MVKEPVVASHLNAACTRRTGRSIFVHMNVSGPWIAVSDPAVVRTLMNDFAINRLGMIPRRICTIGAFAVHSPIATRRFYCKREPIGTLSPAGKPVRIPHRTYRSGAERVQLPV